MTPSSVDDTTGPHHRRISFRLSNVNYDDGSLDWSFANVAPKIQQILNQDQLTSLKKKAHKKNKTDKNSLSKLVKTISFIDSNKNELSLPSDQLDSWSFDIFHAASNCGSHIMIPLTMGIFQSHNLLSKFHIPSSLFEDFVVMVEKHYKHNPFHNAIHGTDVMQTVNSIIVRTGFINLMNDLEIMCVLITALLHDIEHTGTSNAFHRNSRSDMSKLYMVSILENHHIRVGLGLLQVFNLLSGLTENEYEEFKIMMCSMILATDMGNHFALITNMKIISNSPTKCMSRIRIRRIMMLLLHSADISNPAKPWDVHKVWVSLLCQEFFNQGDREKKLKLPISPNCDKNTVNIAASQVGFMEVFVKETFEVLYTIIEGDVKASGGKWNSYYPWLQCMQDNAKKWNETWNSLNFESINQLLEETPKPRTYVIGASGKVQKKAKRRFCWCCCCCNTRRRERQLFTVTDSKFSIPT